MRPPRASELLRGHSDRHSRITAPRLVVCDPRASGLLRPVCASASALKETLPSLMTARCAPERVNRPEPRGCADPSGVPTLPRLGGAMQLSPPRPRPDRPPR